LITPAPSSYSIHVTCMNQSMSVVPSSVSDSGPRGSMTVLITVMSNVLAGTEPTLFRPSSSTVPVSSSPGFMFDIVQVAVTPSPQGSLLSFNFRSRVPAVKVFPVLVSVS